MFLPDANTDPYPDPSSSTSIPTGISGQRPSVKHANTRLHEDDPTWAAGTSSTSREKMLKRKNSSSGSVRGSSPSRSLIDAAVRGTPCKFSLLGYFCH